MSLESWAALATVFILGAMSPGPSLAVVLRNTMVGGRHLGVVTGIGHGLGFGLYAFLAAVGIATALALHETTETILKWGGILLLVYLGARFLQASRKSIQEIHDASQHGSHSRAGFVQGFAMALLNPKILAWMLALYAPFIEAVSTMETLFGMSLLGMGIDATWYITVAILLTRGDGVAWLRAHSRWIDAAMGVLMFVFAGLLFSK
mgnify:CR=1 FL=1|jgi:threonine/homoserine/homoserine lactone efflux protein